MSDSKSIQDAMRNGWKSERLVYRALQDNDADHTFMHEAIAGDPVGFPLAYPEVFRPQSKAMTATLLTAMRNKSLSVVICLPADEPREAASKGQSNHPQTLQTGGRKDSNTQREILTPLPIGILTLSGPKQENYQHRKTMLGINIISAYQGKGYGSEAINWALDWAFRFGGFHRVGLSCYEYNNRGKRLYERLGFVNEGTVRECIWFNRAWHDETYYGMLESEWEKLRAAQKGGKLA
ncbi:acyl-CoA N-acyltransferase [Hypomontagnella monticulosa]|nr:acyl-CoA N-acyltransferase [Hypomontagnella monticulosa]